MLLFKEYDFKNVNQTFTSNAPMSCNSFNVIYIKIYSDCFEKYSGETGEGKAKLRDRVTVHRQHIKQPEHQKPKIEEHIRICG